MILDFVWISYNYIEGVYCLIVPTYSVLGKLKLRIELNYKILISYKINKIGTSSEA